MSSQYNDLLVAQMGEPLDVKKNTELYQRVVAGDAVARRAMIEGNMPMVIAKVESFIWSFPRISHLRDDLTSGGFVGLVNAVNCLADGFEVENPSCYLAKSIVTEIGKAMESETPLRMPYTSKRRVQAAGEEVVVPTVINSVPERFEIPSCEKEVEMRDVIDSCCECEEERTFVAMREAGYKFAEIAAAVNMPLSSAYVMGKELGARVQRKIQAIRNEESTHPRSNLEEMRRRRSRKRSDSRSRT